MNLTTTPNYSVLAEMMGNTYTESDARDFRTYLLVNDVQDTDSLTDTEWADLLASWENDD